MKKLLVIALLSFGDYKTASAQLQLTAEFNCIEGVMTDGSIGFVVKPFPEAYKNASAQKIKQLAEASTQFRYNTFQITSDSLLVVSGPQDSTQEERIHYTVYIPAKNVSAMLIGQNNNASFQKWAAWLLAAIRTTPGPVVFTNQKGEPCR